MPMIDLSFSAGALPEAKLKALLHRATKVLMWWEKIPDTEAARHVAWTFAQEFPEGRLNIGGMAPGKPRYRYIVSTIEGLLDDRAKQGVMRDLLRITLEAEGAAHDHENAARVWCLFNDVPRSKWGIAGVPFAPSGYLSCLDQIQTAEDTVIA
jgi:phenylpyruvate tautomerase PptA (4-oxalocrotonate tautomerase family)